MSDTDMTAAELPVPATEAEANSRAVSIRFDDKDMVTTYANVASVAATTDEILLLFGMNKGWAVSGAPIEVGLSNRIIITTSVARGLVDTLTRVLNAGRV
ncbi:DUF3467 domain-containing protein [Falsiroseomonas stagni]|uniref:Uncharacterized protein n=1 Tax=Falsiroseomonas stagni DSM 19981 TaxID=1123062 RepID=A0A1I4FJ89_9PROT|nr:DUF3467 domain-containing protein [Falsiroseomonas stagni]SFL16977.1 Protein of unknown function [Falsiroseomonas stagni DSM 19981]